MLENSKDLDFRRKKANAILWGLHMKRILTAAPLGPGKPITPDWPLAPGGPGGPGRPS